MSAIPRGVGRFDGNYHEDPTDSSLYLLLMSHEHQGYWNSFDEDLELVPIATTPENPPATNQVRDHSMFQGFNTAAASSRGQSRKANQSVNHQLSDHQLNDNAAFFFNTMSEPRDTISRALLEGGLMASHSQSQEAGKVMDLETPKSEGIPTPAPSMLSHPEARLKLKSDDEMYYVLEPRMYNPKERVEGQTFSMSANIEKSGKAHHSQKCSNASQPQSNPLESIIRDSFRTSSSSFVDKGLIQAIERFEANHAAGSLKTGEVSSGKVRQRENNSHLNSVYAQVLSSNPFEQRFSGREKSDEEIRATVFPSKPVSTSPQKGKVPRWKKQLTRNQLESVSRDDEVEKVGTTKEEFHKAMAAITKSMVKDEALNQNTRKRPGHTHSKTDTGSQGSRGTMFPSPVKLQPTGNSMPEIHRKPVPILKQFSNHAQGYPNMGDCSSSLSVVQDRSSQETSECPKKAPEWVSAMEAMFKGAGGTFKRSENKEHPAGRSRLSPDGQTMIDLRRVRFEDSDSLSFTPTVPLEQGLKKDKRPLATPTPGRLNPGSFAQAPVTVLDESTVNTLRYNNQTRHVPQPMKAPKIPTSTSASSIPHRSSSKNHPQAFPVLRPKPTEGGATRRNQVSPTAEHFRNLPNSTSLSRLYRSTNMPSPGPSHPSLVPAPLFVDHSNDDNIDVSTYDLNDRQDYYNPHASENDVERHQRYSNEYVESQFRPNMISLDDYLDWQKKVQNEKNSLELRESLRGPNMLSLDEYEAFSRQCHDEHEEANREGLSDEEYSRLKKFREIFQEHPEFFEANMSIEDVNGVERHVSFKKAAEIIAGALNGSDDPPLSKDQWFTFLAGLTGKKDGIVFKEAEVANEWDYDLVSAEDLQSHDSVEVSPTRGRSITSRTAEASPTRGRSIVPRAAEYRRSRSLSPGKLSSSTQKENFAGQDVTESPKRARSRSPLKKAKELLGIGTSQFHGTDATSSGTEGKKKTHAGLFAGVKTMMAEKKYDISKKLGTRGPYNKTPSNGATTTVGPTISVPHQIQMMLLSEVEYTVSSVANSFLMGQKTHGNLSPASVFNTHKIWFTHNRPQVLEFRFDITTQMHLVRCNLGTIAFYGPYASDNVRLVAMMNSWKALAQILSVRTFCMPDYGIKKMLRDARNVLEMLGAQQTSWNTINKWSDAITKHLIEANSPVRL